MGLGIVLAVLAAGCYVFAARSQHAAVSGATAGGRLTLRAFGKLCRDRRWLSGVVALGAGAGMHAVALAYAPLSVAQPIGVLTLVAITVVQARSDHRRLTRGLVAALAAATVGIAGFVLLAAGTSRMTIAPNGAEMRAVIGTVGIVTVAVAVAVFGPRAARCVALGVGGGACYGLVSVLTHMVGLQLRFGTVAAAIPAAIGVVLAAGTGGLLVQHAYVSGPPDVVMACTTVVDPLVAIGIGVLLLKESTTTGPLVIAGEVLAAVLAIVGVVVMARFRALGDSHGPRQGHQVSPAGHHRSSLQR